MFCQQEGGQKEREALGVNVRVCINHLRSISRQPEAFFQHCAKPSVLGVFAFQEGGAAGKVRFVETPQPHPARQGRVPDQGSLPSRRGRPVRGLASRV